MRVVLFVHSLISDWNNGHAHFLRGIATELTERGHRVESFEPAEGWSLTNLVRDGGTEAVRRFRERFPSLQTTLYDPESLDLDRALDGADLVIVHEWNDPALIRRVARHRRGRDYRLLFHDTHHRALTDPGYALGLDLRAYDGVLAFGSVLRDAYVRQGWATRAWTWHEAADVRIFRPLDAVPERDLVWIGNWGDGERARELEEYLLEPAHALGLAGTVHGVRYPPAARAAVAAAGLELRGSIANHDVPAAFARHRVTVHVPRGPYVRRLPGIPTIRVFEALACGIPLVSAPWEDTEELFRPGRDFLVARSGDEMELHLKTVLNEPDLAAELARSGLETIRARHTCAHRVDELLAIVEEVR